MAKKILVITLLLMTVIASTVFAANVRIGKYVAGDSRNDLDHDYWLLLNSDQTASIHMPGGSANGIWRYDGYKIYITIYTAYGELAHGKGLTLEFIHMDTTGTVLYGEDDAWWLQ